MQCFRNNFPIFLYSLAYLVSFIWTALSSLSNSWLHWTVISEVKPYFLAEDSISDLFSSILIIIIYFHSITDIQTAEKLYVVMHMEEMLSPVCSIKIIT